MLRTLNINIDLIKRYASSKRRKELLALAIWCHVKRENAVIFGFDRFLLRNNLHIGKEKATRLIADAMEDELFTFDGKNVSVGSFKDKTIKRNRNGQEYCSSMVKKFVFDTLDENGNERKFRLNELYGLINDVLATFPIAAQERKDCLLQDNRTKNPRDAQSRTLTLRKLSQNTMMSVSSTCRIMKRLVKSGDLSKEPSIIYSIIGSEHEEQIQDSLKTLGWRTYTFKHGSMTYIVVPCAYSIANRDVSESFRHKIYGYHRRGSEPIDRKSTIPQLCGY